MTTCPTSEALRALLDGSLPDGDTDAARAHVLACPRCQSALDAMTDVPGLVGWRLAPSSTPAEPVVAKALRDRIEAWRLPPGESRSGDDASSMAGAFAELSMLGPPTRPGDLGCLGAYLVECELGRGGMGIVYRAFDPALQRTVAVKLVRPDLADERSRRRLVREARIAARLRHDHVVAVHAVVDPPEGLPYLVMEYLPGPSLAARIRACAGVGAEPSLAAEWIAQVAEGLAAAHEAGLVHRDVKPANILFDPATARAKLADFGLAYASPEAGGPSRDAAVGGTPAYMSPEQAAGSGPLDARSDVYSLGATLYEALTGEPPFRGSPHMVLRQIVDDDPRPPRRLNDAVPRDLEVVCLKAMAKDPHRRYASALELAADLRRWLRDEPIRARPVGPAEQLGRWCRRRPHIAALAAAVAALLVLLAAGSTVAALRIARERRDADRERLKALAESRRADRGAADARAAQLRAETNARAAAEHFRVAVDALNTLVVEAQDQLGRLPGTIEPRRRLVETAIDGLGRVAHSASERPVVDRSFVVAHDRLGDLFFLLGKGDESRREFARALALAEALLKDNRGDRVLRSKLADVHEKLGNLALYAADFPAAERSYRQAQRVRAELSREDPRDLELRRDLSRTHIKLGDVLQQSGDPAKARSDYVQSLAILDALAENGRGLNKDRYLARCSLGDSDLALLDYPSALANYRQALAHAEALAAGDPEDTSARRCVAWAWKQLGILALRRGDPNAAEVSLGRALELGERLAEADPDNTEWRQDLLDACEALGDARRCAGRLAPAREAYGRGLALSEGLLQRDPGSHRSLRAVVRFLVKLAEVDEQDEQYAPAVASIERGLAACRARSSAGQGTPKNVSSWIADLEMLREVYRSAAGGSVHPGAHPDAKSRADVRLLVLQAQRLARRGEVGPAAAAADAARRGPSGSEDLLAIARAFALCADSQGRAHPQPVAGPPGATRRYQEAAVEALREACRRQPALAQQVESLPDLASLRAAPSYRGFIEDLHRRPEGPSGESPEEAGHRPPTGRR